MGKQSAGLKVGLKYKSPVIDRALTQNSKELGKYL